MCCSLSPAGAALEARGVEVGAVPGEPPGDALRRVRHELHVAGWALALAVARDARRSAGEQDRCWRRRARRGRAGSGRPTCGCPAAACLMTS